MIGLDTNVLIRFLVNDDEVQGQASRGLLASLSRANPGFISREVAVEVAWVLDQAYGLSQQQVAQALEDLVGSAELEFEAAEDVVGCVNDLRIGGGSFADQMIAAAARRHGVEEVYTFDTQAARRIDGFKLVGREAATK